MTPEQMEELFRPFNRLGRERTALQGTGIGLVISRRLAELMGGSIRVKSVPSEGSSFILKLPKAIDPDTVRRRSTTSKPCRRTTTAGSSTTSRTTRPTSRSCAASWRSGRRSRWRSR